MFKFAPARVAVLLTCAVVPFLWGAAAVPDGVDLQASELYANCQYRFGVIFPSASRQPMVRDTSHTTPSGGTVPARQFYVEQGGNRFSVTVADFSTGPVVDDAIVEHAAQAIRQRGEVRFQAAAPYDPGMPGRQLNVFHGNGRQLRASVYMADHRLTITEADAAVGDSDALKFEQSITLIDALGADLDRPNAGEGRIFPCS